MRRGELAGLRWAHACLDGCDEREMPHLHVVETRLRTGSGDDYVLTYSAHHPSPAVRSRPIRPDALTSGVKDACAAAGVPPVHLHGLRHVHASQLIAAGMPITEVSARLGHADTAITLSIYGHAMRSESTDERAAAMWAAAR